MTEPATPAGGGHAAPAAPLSIAPAAPLSTAPAAPLSAGALMRAARERQGLHIAALAAAIKVSPKKLEALEADRWSELPDATFTRALAQTVCRTLKIDARMVLDKLPSANGVNLALSMPSDTQTGGAPARVAAVAAPRQRNGVPVMAWGALLLLAGAALLFFLPPGWSLRGAAPSGVPVASPVASAPAVVAVAAPGGASVAESFGLPASAAEPAASASAAPLQLAETAPASPATVPTAAAPSASALQVEATADSWIDIRDARGEVLVSRLVKAGEALGLDGTPPLRATIGNAAGTQLRWRGQAIDLVGRQQGNVARVELP
jgi:cytoskeleton protein RodZ